MENKFGKTSKLMLKASVKNDKTILEDTFFTAPFKIMHPFYPYDDPIQSKVCPNRGIADLLQGCMTVMCLTASAGIMAGDEQDFNLSVEKGGKMEFVSQAYEKIHKMEEGSATRNSMLSIASDAFLYYNPLPTIPFKDSAFTNSLKVYLEDSSSKFILKEILSAGRYARGEKFEYRFYHNQIFIYEKDQLIYADNTRLEPKRMQLASIGLFENYTHLGTLLLFNIPKDAKWFKAARQLFDQTADIEGGITRGPKGHIIIRILGRQAEKVSLIMDKLLAL